MLVWLSTVQRDDSKKARSNVRFSNPAAVNDRIRELEMRQQTESLSLNDEKTILRELAELNEAKKAMAHLVESKESAAAAGEAEQDAWKSLSNRIKTKSDEIKAVSKRLNAQREIFEGLQTQKNAVRASLPDLFKRREELGLELKNIGQEISATHKAYHEQMGKYMVWKREMDKVRYEQRQKEYREQQERAAEEQRKLEEEEAKRHPWEKEMGLCDALVATLVELVPEAKAAIAEESKGGEGTNTNVRAVSNDGLRVMKKEVEDDWGGLSKKKSKKGKKGKRKKEVMVRSCCSSGHALGVACTGTFDHVCCRASHSCAWISTHMRASRRSVSPRPELVARWRPP